MEMKSRHTLHDSHVMTSTQLEQRLCKAFCEVLDIETVGVDDDFFQIGGDSLKTMVLQDVCKDIRLSDGDVFRHKTPRKIAAALNNRGDELYLAQLPDSVPVTKTQLGIFVECMNHRGEPIYHIPRLLRLPKAIDTRRLCAAIEKAVYAHPGLLSELFVNQEGILSQREASDKAYRVQVEEMSDEEFESAQSRLLTYIKLTNTRLFRIRVIETPSFVYLFADFHHIIFDGDSEKIFFRDVQSAYKREVIEEERFTPYHVSLLEAFRRERPFMEECRQWYIRHYGDIESTSLPQPDVEQTDDEEEEDIEATVIYRPIRISSKDLATAAQKLGVTNNVLAVTAFGMTLNRVNGTDTSSFTTIYNGRDDYRYGNLVSMLVKTLPVVVRNHDKNPFESTKTQLNGAVAHSLYSFADLCKDTAFDNRVSFVYLNGYPARKALCGYECESIMLNNHISNGPLLIRLHDEGDPKIRAEYQTNLFTERKIMNFVDTFVMVLEEIIKKAIE